MSAHSHHHQKMAPMPVRSSSAPHQHVRSSVRMPPRAHPIKGGGHKHGQDLTWSERFSEHPCKYTLYLLLALTALAAVAVVAALAGLGKFSSSGGGGGGGPIIRSAPVYPMTVGSTWGFEYPVYGITNVPPYSTTAGDANGSGFLPPISAAQPFLFTYPDDTIAGCGITSANVFDGFNPPDTTAAPQGAQWAYCQPAHDNTVNISAQTSAMTAGTSYTFTMFFAQRYIEDASSGLSNTTLASAIIVTLDTMIIKSIPSGEALTGNWIAISTTFTWPGPDQYPLLTLAAVGPTGVNGLGLDTSVLFDALKISVS